MVAEQGEVIDNVDNNVSNAVVHVESGRGFLEKVWNTTRENYLFSLILQKIIFRPENTSEVGEIN